MAQEPRSSSQCLEGWWPLHQSVGIFSAPAEVDLLLLVLSYAGPSDKLPSLWLSRARHTADWAVVYTPPGSASHFEKAALAWRSVTTHTASVSSILATVDVISRPVLLVVELMWRLFSSRVELICLLSTGSTCVDEVTLTQSGFEV